MRENIKYTFPAQLKETIRQFPDKNALALVGENPITYRELDQKIKALMAYLQQIGIKKGDKAAILSTNMPNWGIVYYSITSLGAIVVPLLPDFHEDEVENIINHSEAGILFISEGLSSKVNNKIAQNLKVRIRIEDFSIMGNTEDFPKFDPQADFISEPMVLEDDLAAIIYTSGTTGKSKGVMLTHKNILFTAFKSGLIQPIGEDDRFLSVLPLSHTYENTIGLVLPMISGACVYYLGRPPTAPILLPALQNVRPTIMLTVPLIIEKIYRTKILATIRDKMDYPATVQNSIRP